MDQQQSEVEQLIKKAADAHASHDALHFSQAALNAAHAQHVVKQTKEMK